MAQNHLYTIENQHGFADSLARGILRQYQNLTPDFSSICLILPNHRAARAITESFIRQSGNGLILPKMVMVGDIDLGESLGAMLDPMGDAPDIAPVVDPMERLFTLTTYVIKEIRMDGIAPGTAEAMRLAAEMARVMDELAVAEKSTADLLDETIVTDIFPQLAGHWQQAMHGFARISSLWEDYCLRHNRINPAERRNILLRHIAQKWAKDQPDFPIIAAAINSVAPAIAALLKTIAQLPQGKVVFSGLTEQVDMEIWQALGKSRLQDNDGVKPLSPPDDDTQMAMRPQESHPLWHMKYMLELMDMHVQEVEPWSEGKAKNKLVSSRLVMLNNMFLPPALSDRWHSLEPSQKQATGINVWHAKNQETEAQGIAILVRQALEEPTKRIAIVTPDRALATRIIAHLKRWDINIDDSAGQNLLTTPPAILLLALAQLAAGQFNPIDLLTVLKHPLVKKDDDRGIWIKNVRLLDLVLRGPAPKAGLDNIRAVLKKAIADAYDHDKPEAERLLSWWDEKALPYLSPLAGEKDTRPLAHWVNILSDLAGKLSNGHMWKGQAGRQLADALSAICHHDAAENLHVHWDDLPDILRQLLQNSVVRAQFGTHNRVQLYGLLESRLQSADMVICAGLNEGVWPRSFSADPWLAPAVRQNLGMPGQEFRMGLSAHDLASAMGAAQIWLTRSQMSGSAPTIASRFLLRFEAVTGAGQANHAQQKKIAALEGHIAALNQHLSPSPAARPKMMPDAHQRAVHLSVTQMDRLRSDPYAFYASKIMRFSALDGVAAEASYAWRGTMVHDILEKWTKAALKNDNVFDNEKLLHMADEFFQNSSLSSFDIALWQPRLREALSFFAQQIVHNKEAGRDIIGAELKGEITIDDAHNIRLTGKADRIDANADGSYAIVDYKTGGAPSGKQVQSGFAMQLGLLALILKKGGFENFSPDNDVHDFEYWTMKKCDGKSDYGYGEIVTPILEGRKTTGLPRDEFVSTITQFFNETVNAYILGAEPFIAKLNPQYNDYDEYDQLMRLEEWHGKEGDG